jgi:hypothetical protein
MCRSNHCLTEANVLRGAGDFLFTGLIFNYGITIPEIDLLDPA